MTLYMKFPLRGIRPDPLALPCSLWTIKRGKYVDKAIRPGSYVADRLTDFYRLTGFRFSHT